MTESINLTPWTVRVFPGPEHWQKPIDEPEGAFGTEAGAKVYAGIIKLHRPTYWIEIEKED